MRYWFILDVSKTVVLMETLLGKINPYDVALEIISRERFQGIPINMKMASDGRLFIDHIACVIEKAISLAGLSCGVQNFRLLAQQVIDERMRGLLVSMFAEHSVLAAPGLDKFLASLGEYPAGGIVTGDLRDVAKVLMTNNTFGDLTRWFPPNLWTCGDDPGLTSRVDQIRSTYEKLGNLTGGAWTVFVDDAANGIRAMRQFASEAGLNGSALIVGVTTGNSDRHELIKAGANLVLPNIGEIPEAVQSILG